MAPSASALLALCGLLASRTASAQLIPNWLWTVRKSDGGPSNATACPPSGFDSVPNFNLTAYVSAPWYVQKQLPLSYQKPDELYCVRARYAYRTPGKPQNGLLVYNYANRDKVNGQPVGATNTSKMVLGAYPDPRTAQGPTAASKLRVLGPTALLELPEAVWYPASGPYWVVAVGPSANKTIGYDWAIISGGLPDYKDKEGCRPGRAGSTSNQYFGGLWLFSRKPHDPESTTIMINKAKSLGLDTSGLLDVEQKGCMYAGSL